MTFDVDAVATAAAATLAGAIATDGWSQIRNRLAALFSRGDSQSQEATLVTLEQLARADNPAIRLRGMLRARLLTDSALKDELAALVAALDADQRSAGEQIVQAGRAGPGGVVIQVGRDATFGKAPYA